MNELSQPGLEGKFMAAYGLRLAGVARMIAIIALGLITLAGLLFFAFSRY